MSYLRHPHELQPRTEELDAALAALAAGGVGREVSLPGYQVCLSPVTYGGIRVEVALAGAHQVPAPDAWYELAPGMSTPVYPDPFQAFRVRLASGITGVAGQRVVLLVSKGVPFPAYGPPRSAEVTDGGSALTLPGPLTVLSRGKVTIPNTAASQLIVAANTLRTSCVLVNEGAEPIRVTDDGTAADANGLYIAAGASATLSGGNAINGFKAVGAGTCDVSFIDYGRS